MYLLAQNGNDQVKVAKIKLNYNTWVNLLSFLNTDIYQYYQICYI